MPEDLRKEVGRVGAWAGGGWSGGWVGGWWIGGAWVGLPSDLFTQGL